MYVDNDVSKIRLLRRAKRLCLVFRPKFLELKQSLSITHVPSVVETLPRGTFLNHQYPLH